MTSKGICNASEGRWTREYVFFDLHYVYTLTPASRPACCGSRRGRASSFPRIPGRCGSWLGGDHSFFPDRGGVGAFVVRSGSNKYRFSHIIG